MTAIRYCGDYTIRVDYMDNLPGDLYRARISLEGRHVCAVTVGAPAIGFGPGVAFDSPKAFDSVASSALSFATAGHHDGGTGKESDSPLDDGRLGLQVRRQR